MEESGQRTRRFRVQSSIPNSRQRMEPIWVYYFWAFLKECFRQIVPYVGDNEEYSQTLTGLKTGNSYHIQIQALDRNSYVLYTSSDVPAQSSCTRRPPPETE